MRIGVLSQWYAPETGGGSVPGVLARSLAERGHEVQVVTGFPNYPTGQIAPGYQIQRKLDECDGPRVAVRRVALYPNHGQTTVKRFLNYSSFALSAATSGMRKLRNVDAIWVYNSPATVGLPSILASTFRGPPHLMHVMDLWPDSILLSGLVDRPTYEVMARVLESWSELTYRQASAIACTSRGTIDLLVQRGVPENKLHYIPVWTDESVYFPAPYDEELAEQLGVCDRFTLLYAGSLGRAQGLDDFLKVCGRLRDVDELRILIVGSGVLDSQLRKQAEEMKLQNVRFLGQLPAAEMGRLLSISDLNLVSLRKDDLLASIALPSKLPGILASAHAVLAWATGEVARIINDSGAGIVVAPGDAGGLETAVRSAVTSGKASMACLGAKGRSYYQTHLSLESCVDAIENLLRSIAEEPMQTRRTVGRYMR
jgi:glycosyltransferase involved in cell wall biosynthesis